MDEDEVIREAMRLIGRRTSDRKKQTSAENGRKYGGAHQVTDEMRAKMREAQRLRRERERLNKEETETLEQPVEKRKRGRPATKSAPDPNAPKRPVGRPKRNIVAEPTNPDAE